MNRDEGPFIQQVRASLDRDEAEIPAHVATRLRQARHAAIAHRYHRAMPLWMPALSTAMLVLVVAVVWFAGMPRMDSPGQPPVQQAAGDFEMLVHGEDLELFADLDFYLWLDKQDDHAS